MCVNNHQQLQAAVMGLRIFSQKSLVSSYGCEGCESDNGTPKTKHAQKQLVEKAAASPQKHQSGQVQREWAGMGPAQGSASLSCDLGWCPYPQTAPALHERLCRHPACA